MNWVICFSESPKENEVVLLTFKNSEGIHVGVATFKNNSYDIVAETGKGYFEEVYGIPVAWMRMPEPYKLIPTW